MERYFVYIINNSKGIYYKGFSTNFRRRLAEHNENKSFYTQGKGPWNLIFLKEFNSRSEALSFEKMLKRQHHRYLDWLINSERNEIQKLVSEIEI
jgi:putative endonuclease